MTAEEFYKKSDYDIDDYMGSFIFAEAYHQSRVNAIEDKKIIWQTNGMLTDAKNEGFVNGWNACKQQLLKQ